MSDDVQVDIEVSNTTDIGTKVLKRELVVLDISLTVAIALFGLGGNALTVRVLREPNLRRTSTAFYFTVLAAVDILVLLIGPAVKALSAIVYKDERQLRDSHTLLCKAQLFLNYSICQISAWVLVAVTIDRMIWVRWPFKARQLCTIQRAVLVVLLIVALIGGINARHLWYSMLQPIGRNPTVIACTINDTFIKDTYVTYIDPSLITIGPFLVMLTANLVIIRKLHQVRAKREKNLHKGRNNRKEGGSLTKMLMCANFFYLVSSLPYLILISVLKEHRHEILKHPVLSNVVYAIQIFVYGLFNLNYAIHFLLYCLAGQTFIAEAFRLLRIRQRTAGAEAAAAAAVEDVHNVEDSHTLDEKGPSSFDAAAAAAAIAAADNGGEDQKEAVELLPRK